VISRLEVPPLSSQFNNPARLAKIQAELVTLRAQRGSTNAIYRSGEELLKAIQRASQDPNLHEGLANLYEALGDLKRAIEAYRTKRDLLPHDYYCNLQLGRLLGETGQHAEGEAMLRPLSVQRPGVPDVWVELGAVCLAQKKYAEAIEHYKRASRLRPQDTTCDYYIGSALAQLGRRAEAIEAFRRGLQSNPNMWAAHFELAGQLAAENRVDEALHEYAEAVRLNPSHAVSRVNYGVMLSRKGRVNDAIAQFEEALRLEPQNAAAQDYLRQTMARRDQKK
jgi:tetratricopeptide (TPR) repeat protein